MTPAPRPAAAATADTARIAEWRRYAADLRATADGYRAAANAPGMDRNAGRREAAVYLTAEADRLTREARGWAEHADNAEEATR